LHNSGIEAKISNLIFNHLKIIDAKIFQSYAGTGIAVLTTSGRIFLKLSNSKDIKARQLPEIPSK